ncbi:NAD(P)H-hydrate dehydratase [Denitrobacterium detoxificans]|uniref:NAD(P)H-hydrate dehydratase n=1 Tax=Denitrobacterium detoxificans TaxID=79604 RepID=UPI0026E9A5F9|nr:NAD(P)H-hydrate dehydratase [Denitrobacterium detoxificans]
MKQYTQKTINDLLPFPEPQMNKYSRGKVVLIVGSASYPGAAALASIASQRAGAGYTEVFVDDSVVAQVQATHSSLVVRSWDMWDSSSLKPSTPEHPLAYVIGSGFDTNDPYVGNILRRLLKNAKAPVLVDGGALKLMPARKMRDMCKQRYQEGYPTIVTPHGGEAKVLASVFALPVDDQEELALTLSQAYGAITVLKGPDTYISDGDHVYSMTEGTSALAKAGTGDVLAGIIGAFLAQGLGPIEACVLGTTLHARAGRLAAEELTSISVCAEDVLRFIPPAIKDMSGGRVS